MKVLIDSRARINLAALSDTKLRELRAAFTYSNPQYAKLKAMGKRWVSKKIPEVICSWSIGGGEFSVPRGGLEKLREVLGPLRVQRKMTYGLGELAGKIPPHILELREYQETIRRVCIDVGTALIRSPQGSGKTTVGYAIASELNLPTLVVVPTERILRQWVRGVEKNLGMDPAEVGIIQGQTRTIRPLTIGMQQTLRNCASDYLHVFGVIIGDEAQRFAASTFFEVVDLFPAAYRIGVTADERRADKKEFLIYDVFGEVAVEVPRKTLIDQGAIIDAEVRIVPTEFRAEWYSDLAPRARMKPAVQERLAKELSEDESRNALVMEVLGWCANESQPTITLAWRREHCATLNALSLARGWNSGLLMGGKDSEVEFDRTEAEMAAGELNQAVGTYQAVGVGFDLPLVSRGIFAAPCASQSGKQQFGQFCGRYERPAESKCDSIVYYMWDRHVHGIHPVRNIGRWKPKVSVLVNGQWVGAKQYIKELASGAYDEADNSQTDILNP